MAFTEFYVQTTGSNLNAGSTAADAAAYTGVGDSDGTSVFTPSDGSTPANTVSVGDFASVYVTAGATVATFVGRVTAVAAGVNGAVTVSTTARSGTFPAASAGAHTITCKTGGAWQGPNNAVGFPFGFVAAAMTDAAGDYPRVNFKAGTNYGITAAMTHNVAGPCCFQGYTGAPGDLGRATIDGGTSGASYTPLTVSGNQSYLRDLVCQNNGASGSATWLAISAKSVAERVTVTAARGAGIALSGTGSALVECEAYGCNLSNLAGGAVVLGANGGLCERTVSHHNAGSNGNGFELTANTAMVDCVADGNGSVGVLVHGAGDANFVERLTACNNAGPGLLLDGSATANNVLAENCVFANNGTYGVSNTVANAIVRLSNCAFYLNTSGPTNGAVDATGTVTCASQPLNAPTQGDYTPAAGAGLARNAGRGAFTQHLASWTSGTGSTSYPDVGAVQHRDAGGGAPVIGSAIVQGLGRVA